jgi:hypothetical protein
MRFAIRDAALADVEDRSQGRHARRVVHRDAAREVEDPPFRQQTAAPDHVDEREVDEQQPQDVTKIR